jgi:hypothetical protein
MEAILENTTRLAIQPNLLESLKALPDSRLRLIVAIVSAILIGIGWYLFHTIPWFPMFLALVTVMNTPKIKDACLKTNGWLVLISTIVLFGTLVVLPLIPQYLIGFVLAIGNLPIFLTIGAEIQEKMNKRLGIKAKVPVKPKSVKVVKDPALRTNTQKKRDARLLKPKK